MISLDEALDFVRADRWSGRPRRTLLPDAVGETLASDILAPFDSPRFDNSAMDGYAVCGIEGPWTLVGEVAAGEAARPLSAGEAARIFTGAQIPLGTVAVIPQERVVVERGTLTGIVESGRHIRRRGEELREGQVLLPAGARLNPAMIGSLASAGVVEVSVVGTPEVAVLTTGSELRAPGDALDEAQLYESNGVMIRSALSQLKCGVEHRHVRDRIAETMAVEHDLLERNDLLLTIGGVSVGDYDYARPAAEALGFRVLFSGVDIKPGKPISFGIREDGKAWFGLPGNPMSALSTFLVFVREWLGSPLRWRSLPMLEARASGDRDEIIAARWDVEGVRPLASVGSHAIAGWVGADGLIHLPAHAQVAVESPVRFAPFDWRAL